MTVSYKKLWILFAHRKMSKAELRKLAGIAPDIFTKLRRNHGVALSVLLKIADSVLLKIADVLDCDAGDIISFVQEDISEPSEIKE